MKWMLSQHAPDSAGLTRTVLCATSGTLEGKKYENLRRLQFCGMCGCGFAPHIDVLFQPWISVYFSIQTFGFVWIAHQSLTSLPLSVYLFRHRTPRTDYWLSTQSQIQAETLFHLPPILLAQLVHELIMATI